MNKLYMPLWYGKGEGGVLFYEKEKSTMFITIYESYEDQDIYWLWK